MFDITQLKYDENRLLVRVEIGGTVDEEQLEKIDRIIEELCKQREPLSIIIVLSLKADFSYQGKFADLRKVTPARPPEIAWTLVVSKSKMAGMVFDLRSQWQSMPTRFLKNDEELTSFLIQIWGDPIN